MISCLRIMTWPVLILKGQPYVAVRRLLNRHVGDGLPCAH